MGLPQISRLTGRHPLIYTQPRGTKCSKRSIMAIGNGQSVYMNQGEGEASYARNSTLQSAEQNRMKPVVEEAITSLLKSAKPHSRVAVADLGCSSGPNALGLVSYVVDVISRHEQRVPPELCVFLNDLPDNDFNNVAKRLAEYQDTTGEEGSNGRVVAGIVPGSFYNRLFASSSLHLTLSSSSLHWLSEAPQDLRANGIPMYDGDDELRKARRPLVVEAYARQFKKDFKRFLSFRAQELVPGGHMVISVPGTRAGQDEKPDSKRLVWDAIAFFLNDMAERGVIARERLDTFYIPMHAPSEAEMREIIEEEGSFRINKMQAHDFLSATPDKSSVPPRIVAAGARALFEPLIVQHFGKSDLVGEEFARATERHVTQITTEGRVSLCASLTKII